MEKSVKKRKSLKTAFTGMVLFTVVLVTSGSLLTIFGCLSIRQSLVPENDEVLLTIKTITADAQITEETIYTYANGLPNSQIIPDDYEEYTEYTIEPIYSPIQLSPKRKLLYDMLPMVMFIVPLLFTIIGIVLCSLLFYRRKLKEPLAILTESSKKIANDHLDFNVSYSSYDEMGMLCASFEKMRFNLFESKQMILHMIEERRQLNASIAHDLRTPITIIEGYTEYLQHNLPKRKIDETKLMLTLNNISDSAKRLQHYVDSIRDIQSLDELKLSKEHVPLYDTLQDMCADLEVFTSSASKTITTCIDVSNQTVFLDRQALYRILENIVSNAIRYAKQNINLSFTIDQDMLFIVIHDDGPGFSYELLKAPHTRLYKEVQKDGHMGLGLTISELLAKKHGGQMTIDNANSGGAQIYIRLAIT